MVLTKIREKLKRVLRWNSNAIEYRCTKIEEKLNKKDLWWKIKAIVR